MQCPHNEHHYIPSKSLEAHKTSCFYATKGVSRVSLDESCPLVVRKDALYQDKYVPSIEIGEYVLVILGPHNVSSDLIYTHVPYMYYTSQY